MVLALSGWQAAGKDALGAAALDGIGVPWLRVAFGDRVIAEARVYAATPPRAEAVPNYMRSLLDSAAIDIASGKRSEQVRVALQAFGSWQTGLDPDMYIRPTLEAIAKARFEGRSVLVPDVRTIREATALRRVGASVVRVDVDPAVQQRRMDARGLRRSPESARHALETQLDDWPAFAGRIDNSMDSSSGEWPARAALVHLLIGLHRTGSGLPWSGRTLGSGQR